MSGDGFSTSFLPSSCGFAFSNAEMIGQPVRILGVTVGKVIGGLCGGMCVAARDAWATGTDLGRRCDQQTLRRIQLAQVRSFGIPWAPPRYLRLQQPRSLRARLATTWQDAVPALEGSLAAGRPLLLGLVCALGVNPSLLTRHHVVLAYALHRHPDGADSDQALVVRVYDPNHPRDDEVTLQLHRDGSISHSRGRAVYAAFALDRPAPNHSAPDRPRPA